MDRNNAVQIKIVKMHASLSARRAWIEIKSRLQPLIASVASLSARRAWIEIRLSCIDSVSNQSLSARRAWIEICYLDNIEITQAVALRKESVDRNIRI